MLVLLAPGCCFKIPTNLPSFRAIESFRPFLGKACALMALEYCKHFVAFGSNLVWPTVKVPDAILTRMTIQVI
jgi:hypothetical protein